MTDAVSLSVNGVLFDRWLQYSFNSDFLTPTDGFTFDIGGDFITPRILELCKPGSEVVLKIGGLVQGTGYIDVVAPITDKSGGSVVTLHGRDKLSPVVDTQIDPRQTYPENQTLEAFLMSVLKPFGFTSFEIDNERNVTVSAGKAVRRRRHPKKLKEYHLRLNKPQRNEAVFSFISRIVQREGLWIWVTSDGKGIVVSIPDFDQPSRYRIINRRSDPSENNILRGGVTRDSTDQPSFIIARGNVPGTVHETTRFVAAVGNPYDARMREVLDNGSINAQLASLGERPLYLDILGYSIEKESIVIPPKPIELVDQFASTVARPVFLHDDYSRTVDELKRFALREMSLRQRKAVVGRYDVVGHSQNGQPWQVDTVVDVVDELSNWSAPMWIQSRTFRQSRSGGTTTSLEMIPLNTLVF